MLSLTKRRLTRGRSCEGPYTLSTLGDSLPDSIRPPLSLKRWGLIVLYGIVYLLQEFAITRQVPTIRLLFAARRLFSDGKSRAGRFPDSTL